MNTTPDTTQYFLQKLKLGLEYAKTFPLEKCLRPMFPEHQVIITSRFAIRYMPIVAVFALTWQLALGGQLGPAVAIAFFACSLPLQGLWWLGKRSVTPLPSVLLGWFYEIREKFNQAGIDITPVKGTPTYQALAELLNRAFKQLNR
ncbi:hypothetical protein ARADI_0541 [Arsenophonus endosymbiont of Aleurodicus dispersus]|uniref:terminus macrodomain insulation protein YfbV n=1 Tax=Arsenophonus endosymbiont of Aleurodicus dispersus TaxID=235559 RepID=UPI000EB2B8D5|nr:terminus macrodomain insulation protein YfbV [Arsenophonus endosymbiont of Aleurodicus dispersus]VAY02432.1 hypothetical protein ARADI_0541 [Arsenophonus endosymbiont of Aleurodicus dispersus]